MIARRASLLALVAASCLAIVGPGSAATATDPSTGGPAAGGVRVTRDSSTGQVTFLSGTSARPVATAASLGRPATPRAAARAFLARAGRLFGISDPARDLRQVGSERVAGRTFVRYQQTYRGIPVIAAELIVQVGPRNEIISANGEASPAITLSVRPTITEREARRLAIAATARQEKVKASRLRAGPAALAIYDAALTGDPRALPGARLAWRVDVTSTNRLLDEWVAIEATRGGVLAAFNQVASASPPASATQRICDLRGDRATDGEGGSDPLQCDPDDPTLVANPASSTGDSLAAYQGSEATYDFFARRFGRNSLDGAGMTLISTVRYCPENEFYSCPYYNALWNGTQMLYGWGYGVADDVVAHELTHGLTSNTSRLLYWFQSGAISEALSDVFGEFVDFENGLGTDTKAVRWLHGEDSAGGANRNLKDPPASPQGAQPDRMRSPVYVADLGLTDRGGVHTNSGVGNKAAFLMTDGGTFSGQTVRKLGVDKSAAIWYRAASQLLTSGSDYSDLAGALRQACNDLKGTTPKNKSGKTSTSGVITTSDCGEVGKVITATEMAKDASVATVKHTKLCATGTPTTTPLLDRVAADGSPWTTTGTPGVWSVATWFAASKSRAWWGTDTRSASDASLRSKAIPIPATGRTWLAFRHYVNFQDWLTFAEGGVVEYATDPDGPWTDLGSRFTFNGYNGVIATGLGNPLEGRNAFVGMNFGMAQSKAELTFLKGKTIYLRFRLATNADTTGFDGWVIDDVRVYRCI